MKETKFKDTELGKIPEDWSVAQVGDTFSMKRNNTLSRDSLNYSDLAGYKNIHYGDVLVKFGVYIDVATDTLPYVNHDIKFNPDLIENGDVIIADTAEDETVGKAYEVIGISDTDRIVSGLHTVVLHPKKEFASKYLGYFLNGQAYHNSLYNSMQGTKVISISKRAINATSIAYPSLAEQQRIASALSDADALVAELDALIEKKRAIMAGTMQELLTGKRRLKGFDEPWVKTTLEEIGVFSKGKGIARSEANTGGIPAIRYGEIYTTHHNYIKSYGSFVSDEVAIASRKIKKGDILFTASGETKEDIGKSVAFVSSENAYAGGDIIILSPTQKVDSLFLGFLTNASYIQKQKTVKGQGDAVVHITTNSLKSIELSLPSFAEQRAIVEILSDMDAEIAELEAKRDKYKEVRQGMMQQLLTGKIRLI